MRVIRTPDQRLRVFVSSTLGELAPERAVVRGAIDRLRLSPVMFELGARPHPPRELYRAYLSQSHVFVGVYWQRYGWIAPGEHVSGLEDEYRLAGHRPRLLYIKEPAPDREPRLAELIAEFQDDDRASYKRFSTPDELGTLVADDLALLLSERFEEMSGGTGATPSTRPPVPLTETVGRDEDIARVASMLRDAVRFVTLTGPGGIGKTRLAIEAARSVEDAFPDGVHFIPLAPVTDPNLVLATIAHRLSARTEGSRDIRDVVADHLYGTRTLLVLDNLEQVIASGHDLHHLLQLCPGLTILATSRQALRVKGEHEVPVPPLPLPHMGPLEALGAEPSVRLFMDRARAVSPAFELTPENAAAVVGLCRRLDGVPLAIELAAARIRLLSPAALLERLGNRIDVLATAGPDAPPRQRTLRATLDWSHDLLDPDERALFARLSVFHGSLSLAGAEAVCGFDGLPVMETLASLLDKNLLVVDDDPDGDDPRFRMLETVRVYAAERLAERGETHHLRRGHLDYYRELCDVAQPQLCGPGQQEWAARFDPERANLRAAVATAFDIGDHATVVEMSWDVYVYYQIRDAVSEPQLWLARVAQADTDLDEITQAKLDSAHSFSNVWRGELEGTREPLERSLDMFRAHGLDFEAAVLLCVLADVDISSDGDVRAATAKLLESSRLFESVDHDWGVALSETMLGSVLAMTGDLTEGEEHHRRSLEFSTSIDNEPLMARALQQLGLIRLLSGRPDEAFGFVEESARILRRGGYQTEATYCLDALAAVALPAGDPETAARALTVSRAVRRRLGTTIWPSVRSLVDDLVAGARTALGDTRFRSLEEEASDRDVFQTLDAALTAVERLVPTSTA